MVRSKQVCVSFTDETLTRLVEDAKEKYDGNLSMMVRSIVREFYREHAND